jgi:hypothetical protein
MKDLLISARHEILQLRRQNEILAAMVETMELFATVLRTQPNYGSQGMSIDVAWQLEKEIQALEEVRP